MAGELRGNERHLADDGYGYLVSEVSEKDKWCVTAVNGVGKGAKVGFLPCGEGPSALQMWKYGGKQFHNKRNFKRCLEVGGDALKDGPVVRMQDCDRDRRNTFNFKTDGGDNQIILRDNKSYCLTNRGVKPHNSDTIRALECKNKQDRFFFTFDM